MTDQTNRVLDSAEYLAEILGQVPAMVIPCIKGRLTDTSPVIGRVVLRLDHPGHLELPAGPAQPWPGHAATPRCTWPTRPRPRELLGIPDDITQVALLPVAYTTGDDFKPAARGPVEHITYFNQWKDNPT